MIFLRILKVLWSMLDLRGRLQFGVLVGMQLVTAVAGMGGMLAIFGFIKGLTPKETGVRPGVIGQVVAKLLQSTQVEQVDYALVGGGLVLGFIAGKNLLGVATEFLMNRFLMKRNLLLSKDLLDGYLKAPLEQLQAGRLIAAQANVEKVFKVYSKNFSAAAQFVTDLMTVTAVCVLLLWVEPTLTLASAMMFGLAGAITYLVMQKSLVVMARDESLAKERARRHLEHAFSGVVEVRLRDLRTEFVYRYMQAVERIALITRRKNALERVPRTMNEVLLTSMIIGAVLYLTLARQTVADALPTLALFGFAGLRLTGAITRLNTNLQKMRHSGEKLDELAGVLAQVTEKFSASPQPPIGRYYAIERDFPSGVDGRLHREVRLNKVVFRYPNMERSVLKGVSLTIEKGSFVAFCGPSGGGKTTLVQVIMGLLVPVEGEVTCDDWNIQHHIRAWHRNIGYVGQKVFLTDQDAYENVAFGVAASKIDREKVRDALRKASALEFCEDLPEGLETPLKGGRVLSGGQAQRIAIARALYEDPDLLVFDEATAALDNATEKEISDAVAVISKQKTVVSVAHRLSTIKNADRIYFVEKGRISASGRFEDLLTSSEPFREMVEAGEVMGP